MSFAVEARKRRTNAVTSHETPVDLGFGALVGIGCKLCWVVRVSLVGMDGGGTCMVVMRGL